MQSTWGHHHCQRQSPSWHCLSLSEASDISSLSRPLRSHTPTNLCSISTGPRKGGLHHPTQTTGFLCHPHTAGPKVPCPLRLCTYLPPPQLPLMSINSSPPAPTPPPKPLDPGQRHPHSPNSSCQKSKGHSQFFSPLAPRKPHTWVLRSLKCQTEKDKSCTF